MTDLARTLSTPDIESLERTLLKEEQLSCPVTHSFGPEMYVREVRLPAGAVAIGHHQNFEHVNIFLKGRVTLFTPGEPPKELTAPLVFTGQPGRKIGYIHEDVIWFNVYPTSETDVEKLEAHYLTKSAVAQEYSEEIRAAHLLELTNDYSLLLQELNLSEAEVQEQVRADNLIPLPQGSYKIKKGDSLINGKGLFATGLIQEGELIAPALIKGERTIAGRYTNHSPTPNAKMVRSAEGTVNLIAVKDITGCKGGFDGEEITVNYRDVLKLQGSQGRQ